MEPQPRAEIGAEEGRTCWMPGTVCEDIAVRPRTVRICIHEPNYLSGTMPNLRTTWIGKDKASTTALTSKDAKDLRRRTGKEELDATTARTAP